ncbi:MAG: hydroxyethylthiazole kinase [Clostridiales bacterium]
MFFNILTNVRKKIPLTHCITNYVTVNSCANAILAVGGAPIMADDIEEVAEITAMSNALVLNIGTLNKRTVQSMVKAGIAANEKGIPVILDPVGVGASNLRNSATAELINKVKFAAIRGNISEIKNIYDGSAKAHGVDVDISDSNIEPQQLCEYAKVLSLRTGAVIAITGATDVIAQSEKAALLKNGNPMLSNVTGSGCMLSAITGAFLGANPNNCWEATVSATALMGIAGEIAQSKTVKNGVGIGSFNVYLMDALSQIDEAKMKEAIKIEII